MRLPPSRLLLLACQTVAHAAQKIANNRRANLVPVVRQLLHKITQAARRPQQRLHRVASREGLDEALEIDHKGWILNRLLLASATLLADTSGWSRHLVANVG